MIATEQKFGLFSDILGQREDIPKIKLSKAWSPESLNVFLRYGAVKRMPGRLKEFLDGDNNKVQTTDTNPIIKYHRHISTDGTEYEFCATKAHIYRWIQGSTSFLEQFTCSGDCTMWDIVSYNGKVIATNNVDYIQVWDETTPGTDFVNLDGASGLDLDGGSTYCTAAKYVTTYEGYVIFGSTTEGGQAYPFRTRWCSYGDQADYDETGSGDTGAKDFLEGSDRLKGFGHYDFQHANLLVVFKEASHYPMWLVESSDVFNTSKGELGLLATHSVINDKEGNLYWFANDYTIRKYLVRDPISQAIDKTVRAISPTYQDYIEAAFIDNYNHLCWSIPSSASSTGNDKLVSYDLYYHTWNLSDFPVRAFGSYSRQSSYTIDTIPFEEIDGIEWESIDSVQNITGFPLDICSDYSGHTYDLHSAENDNAEEYTGKLVLGTDLVEKKALAWIKRVSNMQLWFKGEQENDFTVAISAKEDQEANWELLGSVSLNASGNLAIVDLPCDLRAHYFEIKLEATNTFELLGIVIDFAWDGDR